jgi:hypothetical protein
MLAFVAFCDQEVIVSHDSLISGARKGPKGAVIA